MILVLFFQAAIGLIIGFYMTDRKRGISFKEMKYGLIFMMSFTSIVIFSGSKIDLQGISLMGVSGVVLFGGIFAGERFHIHLLDSVLNGIHKEHMHETIKRFVGIAKQAASPNGPGKEFVDAELYKTVNELKNLAERANCLKQKEFASQIETVADSCVVLSRLSQQIREGNEEAYRRYERVADSLLGISWDTFSNTEQKIETSLGRNWHLIAFAMKASHMK